MWTSPILLIYSFFTEISSLNNKQLMEVFVRIEKQWKNWVKDFLLVSYLQKHFVEQTEPNWKD